MRATIIPLIMCVMLGGCVSAAEQERQAAAEKAKNDADDDAQCQSYGAKQGTDAYVNCRVGLSKQRADKLAAAQAAAWAYSNNLQRQLQATIRAGQPQTAPAAPH